MEENKVLIDLERYNELILADLNLQMAKQLLFNGSNTLSYNKEGVYFNIDENLVKMLFPVDYLLHYNKLYEKSGEKNV